MKFLNLPSTLNRTAPAIYITVPSMGYLKNSCTMYFYVTYIFVSGNKTSKHPAHQETDECIHGVEPDSESKDDQ